MMNPKNFSKLTSKAHLETYVLSLENLKCLCQSLISVSWSFCFWLSCYLHIFQHFSQSSAWRSCSPSYSILLIHSSARMTWLTSNMSLGWWWGRHIFDLLESFFSSCTLKMHLWRWRAHAPRGVKLVGTPVGVDNYLLDMLYWDRYSRHISSSFYLISW